MYLSSKFLKSGGTLSFLVTDKFAKKKRRNRSLEGWFLFFALHLLLGNVFGEMSEYTIAAKVGDTISLSDLCQISSSEEGRIYWAKEGKSNVSHLTKNGEFVVDNATLEDAGTYFCHDDDHILCHIDLIISNNVPYQESNSAQFSSQDNSDYLRVLGISTAISIFALATLVSGIALLLFRNRTARKQQLKDSPGEDESLELVPNITLNPSFNIDMLEHIEAEYNETSEHTFLVESPR